MSHSCLLQARAIQCSLPPGCAQAANGALRYRLHAVVLAAPLQTYTVSCRLAGESVQPAAQVFPSGQRRAAEPTALLNASMFLCRFGASQWSLLPGLPGSRCSTGCAMKYFTVCCRLGRVSAACRPGAPRRPAARCSTGCVQMCVMLPTQTRCPAAPSALPGSAISCSWQAPATAALFTRQALFCTRVSKELRNS